MQGSQQLLLQLLLQLLVQPLLQLLLQLRLLLQFIGKKLLPVLTDGGAARRGTRQPGLRRRKKGCASVPILCAGGETVPWGREDKKAPACGGADRGEKMRKSP